MQWNRLLYGLAGTVLTGLVSQPAFSSGLLSSFNGFPSFSWVARESETVSPLNLTPFVTSAGWKRRAFSVDSPYDLSSEEGWLGGNFHGVPDVMAGGTVPAARFNHIADATVSLRGWSSAAAFSDNPSVGVTRASEEAPVKPLVETSSPPDVDTTAPADNPSNTSPVPLPGAVYLFGAGLAGLFAFARKKNVQS